MIIYKDLPRLESSREPFTLDLGDPKYWIDSVTFNLSLSNEISLSNYIHLCTFSNNFAWLGTHWHVLMSADANWSDFFFVKQDQQQHIWICINSEFIFSYINLFLHLFLLDGMDVNEGNDSLHKLSLFIIKWYCDTNTNNRDPGNRGKQGHHSNCPWTRIPFPFF